MNTTTQLATLNIQIDRDIYNELKNLAHAKKTSLAKLFRDFATQIVLTQKTQKQLKTIINIQSPLPITDIETSNDLYDYSPILAPDKDESPVFRLPSSIRFQ